MTPFYSEFCIWNEIAMEYDKRLWTEEWACTMFSSQSACWTYSRLI